MFIGGRTDGGGGVMWSLEGVLCALTPLLL